MTQLTNNFKRKTSASTGYISLVVNTQYYSIGFRNGFGVQIYSQIHSQIVKVEETKISNF